LLGINGKAMKRPDAVGKLGCSCTELVSVARLGKSLRADQECKCECEWHYRTHDCLVVGQSSDINLSSRERIAIF
jgi:hypothetical protein